MTNVKNYLLQNRILLPLLLLSILKIPPWTQSYRFQLPSFIRPVALIKNFNHHHLIIDIDHQPSDYWWDDTNPQLRHSQIGPLLATVTPFPLLELNDPTSASLNNSRLFSCTKEDLTLPSPHFFPPLLVAFFTLLHTSTMLPPLTQAQIRQKCFIYKTTPFSNSNVTAPTVFLKQQRHKKSPTTKRPCSYKWPNEPFYDFRNLTPPL